MKLSDHVKTIRNPKYGQHSSHYQFPEYTDPPATPPKPKRKPDIANLFYKRKPYKPR